MASLATIGVLGGMGPQATILFMQKVLRSVEAGDDRDHIPLLVDNNTQVPSRIKAILEDGDETPGKTLAYMARRLEDAGANALVMPCNTAHHYAEDIAAAIDIPFINMVVLSVEFAKSITGLNGRIGVLGSPALRKVAVYENALKNAGLSAVYSDDEQELLRIIKQVKSKGPSAQIGDALNLIAADLIDQGADAIMICCTEFSVLAEHIKINAPVCDTLDVLVKASAQFAKNTSNPIPPTNIQSASGPNAELSY